MTAFVSSNPPPRDQSVSFEQLAALIVPTLGKEKSHELILSRAKSLGYSADRLNLEQALKILAVIGSESGIVGVAARFAKTRLVTPHKKQMQAQSMPRSLAPAVEAPVSSVSPSVGGTLESEELVALLAQSLGTEKSREVVHSALSDLRITPGRLTAGQANAVLEITAKIEGIVGVTSRFAKARLILQLKRES
ncbi:MAG TPA: hypothetical protein VK745_07315 [Polyangiaceae bacterium]|jgi:hypothetical protein|nr:hypothetical protein [Polyangiaceae bacterium]